jgi:hypothetical protein
VWNRTRVTRHAVFAVALFLAALGSRAQTPRRPSLGREAWYQFLLKNRNANDFDYGAWLEKRRQALLDSSLKQPGFWYSLSVTACSLFLMGACTKLWLDNRRRMRLTGEMMAEIYSHDLYSRQVAKEAIERHNRHIEQCNRVIEAGEAGDRRPGWGDTALEGLKVELQRVAGQLEATTQERNKLQEELRQKALIVADLSTRLDNLAKKVGARGADSAVASSASGDGNGDSARFVGQINRLQEELRAERQKNRRLKGA